MAGRDRTAEFIATVNSIREKPQWIQKRKEAARVRGEQSHKQNPLATDEFYKQFMKMSKDCAYRLGASYEKLERLTELAKRKTVFDDSELNRLVADIRKDINDLKGRVDELSSKQQPKQAHSKNIVTSLQQRLAEMSNNFKTTLEMRSRSVQQQTARQELYALVPSSSSTSTLHQRHPYSSSTSATPNMVIDMNGVSDPLGQTPGQLFQHPQQQQQHLQLLQNDDSYMMERVNTMQTIESTIVELGTIFNQLATMVQAQDETITRIDTNISETAGNVELAHDALLRYFSSINSNRWLILKVFGILFFLFVIFVMFGG